MNIPNYTFKIVTGNSYYSGPGVFIYLHQATGKCFVKVLRNSQMQKSKKNYPKYLKELLKHHHSEVVLFFAELTDNTKEALFLASQQVVSSLFGMGKLYLRPNRNKDINSETRYTVWSMVHIDTGAVFYFEEQAGLAVQEKVAQRLKTFNNYVAKEIVNLNRVVHEFTKQHYPLQLTDWVIRDLDTDYATIDQALKHITRLSKTHLEAGEVVLNRVCNTDALYYRNTLLKLPHVNITTYLQPQTA